MGYEASAHVLDGEGDTWATVLHGGTNGVLVQASGRRRRQLSRSSGGRGRSMPSPGRTCVST